MFLLSPLEWLCRYTVIIGVVLCMFGLALCILAKFITLAVRKTEELNKNDRLYLTLFVVGICLIMIGMISIALPIEASFYVG
ncbi:MAG: hypothetical protein MJ152_04715 [Clostridia bacterium]|nr:hypothetical protein [Clostridia bacterium]